jgi:chaperonin GroES
LLDRIGVTPYPRGAQLALRKCDCQGFKLTALGGVEYARIPIPMANRPANHPFKGTVMAKTKFRPLHDRVVVKRIDAEEKTKGGIIIPDSAKEKPSQGEITAVGPGGRDESGKLIPIDLKVGDRVLFGKWSGTEVKLDGEELLIMKESDIMGVLV